MYHILHDFNTWRISHIAMTHFGLLFVRRWLAVNACVSYIRNRKINKNLVDNIPGSTGALNEVSCRYTISVLLAYDSFIFRNNDILNNELNWLYWICAKNASDIITERLLFWTPNFLTFWQYNNIHSHHFVTFLN